MALLVTFGCAVTLAFIATADRYEKVGLVPTPTPMPAMVGPPAVVVREVAVPVRAEPTETPTVTPTPSQPQQGISPPPPPTPAAVISEVDQAAVYAAVIRQLYTVDHTFGDQPPNFPVVYLVRGTDDGVGDPNAPRTGTHVLQDSTQTAITAALVDLPAEFRWVEDADNVPREAQTGAVADGGAIITLGNVHLQEDGSALVSAQLYFAMLGATGKTYVLEQVDGVWQVTGDTGVQWMS